MFYVYTSWGCMMAAVVVVFVWVHNRPDAPPPGEHMPHLPERVDVDRWACSGVAVLAASSCVLMAMHFALPIQEQQMDQTWADIANRSILANHITASGPYMRI